MGELWIIWEYSKFEEWEGIFGDGFVWFVVDCDKIWGLEGGIGSWKLRVVVF